MLIKPMLEEKKRILLEKVRSKEQKHSELRLRAREDTGCADPCVA